MKPLQYLVAILAAICIVLSLLTVMNEKSLTNASTDLENQRQDENKKIQEWTYKINQGNQYQQVLFRMVQEVVQAENGPNGEVKDEKLKDLLDKSGIKINLPPNASASPAPATTPH